MPIDYLDRILRTESLVSDRVFTILTDCCTNTDGNHSDITLLARYTAYHGESDRDTTLRSVPLFQFSVFDQTFAYCIYHLT